MGESESLSSTANKAGTVYFAEIDSSSAPNGKLFGELWYDNLDGNRVKISPRVTSIAFAQNGSGIYLNTEDNLSNYTNIPVASETVYGIINTGAQTMAGNKTFTGNLSAKSLTLTNTSTPHLSMTRSTYNYIRVPKDASLCVCAQDSVSLDDSALVVTGTAVISGKNNTFDLGSASRLWKNIYGATIHATDIEANSITAPSITVSGLMDGNAASANKLFAAVNINGTLFDGSKEIITNAWGTKRNIKISNAASENADDGIDVDGTGDFVLTIPSSMSGFAEILGTNLGSSASPWDKLYLKEGYFYNTTTGYHKVVSAATSAQTMTIPNASGSLIYKATDTTDTGDDDAPIYITSTGSVAACDIISVEHGGTGRASLTKGSIIIGEGVNAVSFVEPTTKGAILISGNSNSSTEYKPTFASPSLSWTSGTTAGPTLKFSIGGAETTSAIPIASDSVSGVVTASSTIQYFKGPKTFNGALTAASTFSASGAATFNSTATFDSTVNLNSNMKLTASSKIHGPTATKSYATFTDAAITLTSPVVSLQGDVLVLDPSTYGATLPSTTDSKNTEGRVFFVLT